MSPAGQELSPDLLEEQHCCGLSLASPPVYWIGSNHRSSDTKGTLYVQGISLRGNK